MNRLYTMFACCLCTALTSCEKGETLYHQSYDVTYFQNSDSFVAEAYFHSNVQTGIRVILSAEDAIFFNGKIAERISENTYSWTGAGKTDVRFLLSKRKKQLMTTETGSRFADLELLCPDTISKMEGHTIRAKGVPGRFLHVYIVGRDSVVKQYEITNDSVCLAPAWLKHWQEGPAVIGIVETIPGNVMRDGDMSGTFNYHLVYEKRVCIVK